MIINCIMAVKADSREQALRLLSGKNEEGDPHNLLLEMRGSQDPSLIAKFITIREIDEQEQLEQSGQSTAFSTWIPINVTMEIPDTKPTELSNTECWT